MTTEAALLVVDILLLICIVTLLVWTERRQAENQRDFREVERRLKALETTKSPARHEGGRGSEAEQ